MLQPSGKSCSHFVRAAFVSGLEKGLSPPLEEICRMRWNTPAPAALRRLFYREILHVFLKLLGVLIHHLLASSRVIGGLHGV